MADGGGVLVLFVLAVLLDQLRKARQRQAASRRAPRAEVRSPVVDAWRRALEEAGPIGRHPDWALEPAEEVEEGESLEVGARVTSPETGVVRAQRQVVDLDDESRLAVARRLKESSARNRPHGAADHRAFDAKVRELAPAAPAVRRVPTSAQLREAIRWREILDRPVGWRDEV